MKANRGAAGVDDQSIEAFDQDVKNNLFKLWNRLSSGSYFPPQVKRVTIKKRNGGSRPLGIPTVSDRIAQGVVWILLKKVEASCDRYLIAGGTNVEAEWEQGPAV